MDEKPYKYENLPIPSYEEAILSRPTSSQSRIGPEETSDDAERQGLLDDEDNDRAPRRSNYVPPTVESQRNSLDSLDGLEFESEAEVRREMQEMDIEDPNSDNGSHRSLLTYRFKRLTSFTNSFTSLRLPSFRNFVPSIRLPQVDWQAVDANRIVILGRLFGAVLIMGLLYVLIASDILSFGKERAGMGPMFDPESVRAFIQSGFGEWVYIDTHLEHITKFPHLAGSEGSYVLGEWIAELFKDYELEDVSLERFEVYLNYPRKDGRRVAIVEPQDQQWEAPLEEDTEETLVFHGHSRSGDVTGPLVYANFGSREDFQILHEKGISVKDSVVLVRHRGMDDNSGLMVKAAEEAGAVGCIIFSDPARAGITRRSESDQSFPANGVQRGAVSLMSRVIGDVLSPGWPSTPGNNQRLIQDESAGLPNIPSIPISWQDASPLLKALHNHGERMDGDWAGSSDVEYWTGDQTSPKVNLKNLQDEETRQPIYNVIGRITGWEQPDKKIIVGNHRDAWCLGASEPGSGTAIMLAMIRIFGELRHARWRPLRTIEFVSWDAGEYNAAGSTEHVENREDELRRSGIAYLNVDAAVTGSDFHAAGSPLFGTSMRRILGRVSDPNTNKTIRETWEAKGTSISPIGAGSDFTAFQHIAGTSSIDMSFKGQYYPKGSCYDNNEWMTRVGDPDGPFEYSSTLGQIWALLILDLADAPLLPLDLDDYIQALSGHIDGLESELRDLSLSKSNPAANLDISPLKTSLEFITKQVRNLEVFDQQWHNLVYGSGGFESSSMTVQRIDRNNRVANFESNLLDLGADVDTSKVVFGELGGLVNRTQYKHVITAPKMWDVNQVEIFPSIRQWIEIEDWSKAQDEVMKVAAILEKAGKEITV